jgi:branched-chain amino acid transport system ATP-binding protein
MTTIMNNCTRIVVMDHGKMIAEGNCEEVQNNPSVIECYLGKDYHARNQ